MRKHALIVGGCCLVLCLTAQGRTQTFSGRGLQAPMGQEPVVTNCRIEARTFSSLKTGEVDFCRRHMKYAPGAVDCYRFEAQVCDVFQPTTQQWTENRQVLPPSVLECPEEIEPPLCPSSPAFRW